VKKGVARESGVSEEFSNARGFTHIVQ